MERISVIVPIYNGEKWLERCVDSITNQTYKNLEIILVDDGSQDSSLEICNRLAHNDDRIVVLSQENQGVQSARDTGIKRATGDYIAFVDADDWAHPDMLEYLHSLITSGEYQISACLYHLVSEDGMRTDDGRETIKILSFTKMVKCLYENSLWSLWGKLYKKDLFDAVPQLDVKLSVSEDLLLNYYLQKASSHMIASSAKKYYYFRHGDSAVGRGISEKRIVDSMTAYQIIEKDIDRSTFAYSYHIANMISNDFMLLNEIIRQKQCRQCYKALRREIVKYRAYVFKQENSYCFKLRHKLSAVMLTVFPPIYDLMIKVFR